MVERLLISGSVLLPVGHVLIASSFLVELLTYVYLVINKCL